MHLLYIFSMKKTSLFSPCMLRRNLREDLRGQRHHQQRQRGATTTRRWSAWLAWHLQVSGEKSSGSLGEMGTLPETNMGATPKMVDPTTMGFPTKNDHFGGFGGTTILGNPHIAGWLEILSSFPFGFRPIFRVYESMLVFGRVLGSAEIASVDFFEKSLVYPPLKLTFHRLWKWMVGRWGNPFGFRPIFRGFSGVLGSVGHVLSSTVMVLY